MSQWKCNRYLLVFVVVCRNQNRNIYILISSIHIDKCKCSILVEERRNNYYSILGWGSIVKTTHLGCIRYFLRFMDVLVQNNENGYLCRSHGKRCDQKCVQPKHFVSWITKHPLALTYCQLRYELMDVFLTKTNVKFFNILKR